ncbi:cupin domain-containing protein [Vibrio coralliilyticus]|uniref:ribosomal protein uL16 3-hydroxylase n=1 Tax=Vibrio coralliilyticus TaxID=190893 RepID=UPI0006CE2269|nr:cupin domain-containing protein [Vibrio coralliilyticus]AXN30955.1 cupin domain-containing protein [Vibrio coralliilyticus]KPH27336.1 50S ribosomal protein L16 arginine hydroxylase [Vibrio coralliilyticus]
MSYPPSFDMAEFLAQYWHKKPTVIKGGFNDFIDPISPDELAGLAMEEEVDSRYISNIEGKWSAQHGPFDDSLFENLPESHWQLVVQACNHWHLGAAELIEPFKQLPNWLFDDLMVCFSAPEGGVGPHIDQYDVFIIQGSGKRRWRVGDLDKGQYKESIQAGALRQIEGFDAIIDEVLEPGDILYIPPGFPHEGNTLEPSMSYSMGFRSPKEQELLSNFADYVLANEKGDVHLHNPEMTAQHQYGEILNADLDKLTTMLRSALQSESDIREFMGGMLSQSRHQLDIVEPEEPINTLEIYHHLESLGSLRKVSGLRALYHENESAHVYINGDAYPAESQHLVHLLCSQESIEIEHIDGKLSDSQMQLLTTLVNLGYWYLD